MTPALPEAIILVLAPFAPLFSERVWLHAQVLLLMLLVATAEAAALRSPARYLHRPTGCWWRQLRPR
jgi:hypothetical protein